MMTEVNFIKQLTMSNDYAVMIFSLAIPGELLC